MGPLDFNPDRTTASTVADQKAAAREALVGEFLPDRKAGDSTRSERQEVPQFERTAEFSSASAAWSSVFGSSAELSAAIRRLSAPVDQPGDSRLRAAAPAPVSPPEPPRPPQVEIPGWALNRRAGQSDGSSAAQPPYTPGADISTQPGYTSSGDGSYRAQPRNAGPDLP